MINNQIFHTNGIKPVGVKKFYWYPTDKQWWITGFNPDTVGEADVSKQVMISSVKFENNELLYDSFKKTADPSSDMYNQDLDKFGIFDDNNNTLWLMWYGESSL